MSQATALRTRARPALQTTGRGPVTPRAAAASQRDHLLWMMSVHILGPRADTVRLLSFCGNPAHLCPSTPEESSGQEQTKAEDAQAKLKAFTGTSHSQVRKPRLKVTCQGHKVHYVAGPGLTTPWLAMLAPHPT